MVETTPWDAWSQAGYNNTYSEILSNNGYAKADYCDENRWLGLHNGYVSEWFELHTIEIPRLCSEMCI